MNQSINMKKKLCTLSIIGHLLLGAIEGFVLQGNFGSRNLLPNCHRTTTRNHHNKHHSTCTLQHSKAFPSKHHASTAMNESIKDVNDSHLERSSRLQFQNGKVHSQNVVDSTSFSRRSVVKSMLSLATVSNVLTTPSSKSYAAPIESTQLVTDNVLLASQPNLKCLLDLPPVKPNTVRLYLCRHGQTEYNRLKLMQGSRIDAPLNETGQKQAIRIGEALSYLGDSGNISSMPMIKAGAHSTLTRARQTATIAATTLESVQEQKQLVQNYYSTQSSNDDEVLKFISNSVTRTMELDPMKGGGIQLGGIQLQPLSSLGEVDFGPLNEGKGTALAKADMVGTLGAWAMGKIDTKLGGEGESGRDVLTRAASALNSLVDIASNNGGTAVAFSHSTYLRMLLALVMDVPLVNAATLEQKNCCINVLDVSTLDKRIVGPKSNLFGALSSVAPQDFSLTIPYAVAVRVNEVQHLNGLV